MTPEEWAAARFTLPGGTSRTSRNTERVARAWASVITRKVGRQLKRLMAQASGAVAETLPRLPAAIMKPETFGNSWCENQLEIIFCDPISAQAVPRPRCPRPARA